MSNAPVKESHPFNVFSVFEVSETLAPADNRNYTYRGTTVALTCDGWEGDNPREYDGTLIAYCGPMDVPLDDHCYALRAKMIPQVDNADFKLFFEADHKILVGNSSSFAGQLNNNTAASGFGIVSTKSEISEPNSDDVTLAFVMRHKDYHPELRDNVAFEVEYRIRPTQKLKKSQSIIQEGKETLVHGFIVDWNDQSNRWVVEVTAINIASGHQVISKKKATFGSKVTPSGRVRPAKHVPSSSPSHPVHDPKGKKPAQPTASTSSVGPHDMALDHNEEVPETGPSTPTRATGARNAKKAKVA